MNNTMPLADTQHRLLPTLSQRRSGAFFSLCAVTLMLFGCNEYFVAYGPGRFDFDSTLYTPSLHIELEEGAVIWRGTGPPTAAVLGWVNNGEELVKDDPLEPPVDTGEPE